MQNIFMVAALFFLALGEAWAGGGSVEEGPPELPNIEQKDKIEDSLNAFINAVRQVPKDIPVFAQQLCGFGLSFEQLKELFTESKLSWEMAIRHLSGEASNGVNYLRGMIPGIHAPEDGSAVKENNVLHVMGEIETLEGLNNHSEENALIILAIDGVLLDGDPDAMQLINPNTALILNSLKEKGATVWGYTGKTIADLQSVVYQIHRHEILFSNHEKNKYRLGSKGFDSGIIFADGWDNLVTFVKTMLASNPPLFSRFSKVVIVSDKDSVVEHMNKQASFMSTTTEILHFTYIPGLAELQKLASN